MMPCHAMPVAEGTIAPRGASTRSGRFGQKRQRRIKYSHAGYLYNFIRVDASRGVLVE
jgi:hypothetical protein